MKIKYLLAASVVSLTAAATIATPAVAQQITSGIEGQVTDDAGAAIPGATVTVTDTRTGQTRTLNADASGNFRAGSLVPGGPYTVTATAAGYEGQTVEGQYINISGNTEFSFNLSSTAAGSSDNVIIVTGARANVKQLAVGPGIAFDTQTLEEMYATSFVLTRASALTGQTKLTVFHAWAAMTVRIRSPLTASFRRTHLA